ncbi:hypothetical protein CCUS01_14444 [Colletotrichum cuscutae]|uniref:Uncharacterized protein n=1 Tax=Colletotrichum cuscutae TaxID=1209917 RepID=A0AAJ0DLC7_9PEZI|nr:hypothetical protein CCUS01_14444 [Colletotrichum cuscutae]
MANMSRDMGESVADVQDAALTIVSRQGENPTNEASANRTRFLDRCLESAIEGNRTPIPGLCAISRCIFVLCCNGAVMEPHLTMHAPVRLVRPRYSVGKNHAKEELKLQVYIHMDQSVVVYLTTDGRYRRASNFAGKKKIRYTVLRTYSVHGWVNAENALMGRFLHLSRGVQTAERPCPVFRIAAVHTKAEQNYVCLPCIADYQLKINSVESELFGELANQRVADLREQRLVPGVREPASALGVFGHMMKTFSGSGGVTVSVPLFETCIAALPWDSEAPHHPPPIPGKPKREEKKTDAILASLSCVSAAGLKGQATAKRQGPLAPTNRSGLFWHKEEGPKANRPNSSPSLLSFCRQKRQSRPGMVAMVAPFVAKQAAESKQERGTTDDDCRAPGSDGCWPNQIWLVNSDPVSWFCFGALGAVVTRAGMAHRALPFLAIGDVDNVGGWHPTETCDCPARCLTSRWGFAITRDRERRSYSLSQAFRAKPQTKRELEKKVGCRSVIEQSVCRSNDDGKERVVIETRGSKELVKKGAGLVVLEHLLKLKGDCKVSVSEGEKVGVSPQLPFLSNCRFPCWDREMQRKSQSRQWGRNFAANAPEPCRRRSSGRDSLSLDSQLALCSVAQASGELSTRCVDESAAGTAELNRSQTNPTRRGHSRRVFSCHVVWDDDGSRSFSSLPQMEESEALALSIGYCSDRRQPAQS